jgi:hypothetical protein
MSKKDDYTEAEWKAISGAPVAAGLFITLSDASGPVGVAKEAMAVGQAIADSASGDTPEIVKAIAENAKAASGRLELPDVPRGDRDTMKAALTGVIKTAVGAIQAKSPAEANAYKNWLASVAMKVAQASKEGGFLGFGGTLISAQEREALNELAGTLGVSAPSVAST